MNLLKEKRTRLKLNQSSYKEMASKIEFSGIQKTTLIDYPGEVACTLFLSGCNFRCPYCFNVDLVNNKETGVKISHQEALDFLVERKSFHDGVCITGGEPLGHNGLFEFLIDVKKLGFKVKIDTNGTYPDFMNKIIENNLVNYIAMDIKGPIDKYSKIARTDVNIENIKKSVEIIKNSNVDYEFRTTVFSELEIKDFINIGKWLSRSKKYCLQQVDLSIPHLENSLQNASRSADDLKRIARQLDPFFDTIDVRIK